MRYVLCKIEFLSQTYIFEEKNSSGRNNRRVKILRSSDSGYI